MNIYTLEDFFGMFRGALATAPLLWQLVGLVVGIAALIWVAKTVIKAGASAWTWAEKQNLTAHQAVFATPEEGKTAKKKLAEYEAVFATLEEARRAKALAEADTGFVRRLKQVATFCGYPSAGPLRDVAFTSINQADYIAALLAFFEHEESHRNRLTEENRVVIDERDALKAELAAARTIIDDLNIKIQDAVVAHANGLISVGKVVEKAHTIAEAASPTGNGAQRELKGFMGGVTAITGRTPPAPAPTRARGPAAPPEGAPAPAEAHAPARRARRDRPDQPPAQETTPAPGPTPTSP